MVMRTGERMGNCKAWDVVKVPFPYTKRPVQQYRAALVVATIELNMAEPLGQLSLSDRQRKTPHVVYRT